MDLCHQNIRKWGICKKQKINKNKIVDPSCCSHLQHPGDPVFWLLQDHWFQRRCTRPHHLRVSYPKRGWRHHHYRSCGVSSRRQWAHHPCTCSGRKHCRFWWWSSLWRPSIGNPLFVWNFGGFCIPPKTKRKLPRNSQKLNNFASYKEAALTPDTDKHKAAKMTQKPHQARTAKKISAANCTRNDPTPEVPFHFLTASLLPAKSETQSNFSSEIYWKPSEFGCKSCRLSRNGIKRQRKKSASATQAFRHPQLSPPQPFQISPHPVYTRTSVTPTPHIWHWCSRDSLPSGHIRGVYQRMARGSHGVNPATCQENVNLWQRGSMLHVWGNETMQKH